MCTLLYHFLSIYQVAMTIEGGEQEVNVSSGGRMAIKYTLRLDDARLLPEG